MKGVYWIHILAVIVQLTCFMRVMPSFSTMFKFETWAHEILVLIASARS